MARNAVVSLVIKGRDLSKNALKRAGAGIGKLKASVVSLNGALAAIGVTATIAIGKRLVKAFGVQERAIIRVKQSLANAGLFTEKLTKQLEDNAAALQRVTQAGDEAILEGTATIADLANKLTGPDFLKVQEAMIGLADTFFNGNIRQAATLLAKTIGGPTNALARYGIEVDTAGTQQEKLNQILKVTAPFFRTSQAAATDITGIMTQLSNSLGDLEETFGGIIVATLNLRDETDGLRELVDGMTSSIQENEADWINWGKFVLATLRSVGNSFVTASRLVFNTLGAIVDTAIIGLARFDGFLLSILDKVPFVDLTVSRAQLANIVDQSLDDLASRGDAIVDIGDKAAAAWGNFVETFVNAVNRVEGATSRQAFTPLAVPDDLEADLAGRGVGGFMFAPMMAADLAPINAISNATLEAADAAAKLRREFEAVFDQTRAIEGGVAGFADGLSLAIDGSLGLGEAFASGMSGAIQAVANQFRDFFLAKATAAIGEGLTFNPAGFAAALKFTAAAGLMGAIGSGGGGFSGIAGGGSGVGGSARQSLDDGRSFSADQGVLTLILEGDESTLDHNNPKSVDRFARMMERASGRRVVIRRTG